MTISHFDFGTTKEGEAVEGYRINSDNQFELSIINRGATITSFKMTDKNGKLEECTLGFDNIRDYEEYSPYFGATIGRVGNRIGKGKFNLDGKNIKVALNDNNLNHLHGGIKGFDKMIWDLKPFENGDEAGLVCTYRSVDGEENYPGNLDVKLTYTFNSNGVLTMDYEAVCDKKTPINLTNHTYWNLTGDKKDNVFSHNLNIEGNSYLPVDDNLIPTGEIKEVEGSPFDFRVMKEIGPAIEATGGFDHNFVLSLDKKEEPVNRIYLEEPKSGRAMEVLTTEPGVQFYSGFFLRDLSDQGFDSFEALCLETQMFPDSVNNAHFPSPFLNPGETYKQKTIHKFKHI